MKTKNFVCIALAAIALVGCSQSKTVELPLTMHDGYGPFGQIAMRGLSPSPDDPNNPWYKTFPKISRLPDGLTDVQSGSLSTNFRQNTYQIYLAGNLTEDFYKEIQRGWNWTPDTTMLSKSPVRTDIVFAYGKDAEGATKFVLDANGNLDLSDDSPVAAMQLYDIWNPSLNKDSLLQVHGVRASVEAFVHDKIVPVEVPVLVARSDDSSFLVNIATHATASYKGQQIAVNSSGFNDLSFHDLKVGLIPDEADVKLIMDDIYGKGEYIEIEGEVLKIVDVNTNKNVLVLERSDAPKSELVSTQVGYSALPFAGEEFTAHSSLSLESLRGKYVFLDFWATWCGPCISEFPNLRDLYSKTDRSRFEIVGIIGRSQPEDVAELLEKHGVIWPQILSDDICTTYKINKYPTTLLIDPDGVIIAKDLRGPELAKLIMGFMEKSPAE